MKNTELVRLNERWQVVDDPAHWILERRASPETYAGDGSVVKPARWAGNAYCTTRAALLRNIRARAGDVDPVVVAFIETWPEQHAPGAVNPVQKREISVDRCPYLNSRALVISFGLSTKQLEAISRRCGSAWHLGS